MLLDRAAGVPMNSDGVSCKMCHDTHDQFAKLQHVVRRRLLFINPAFRRRPRRRSGRKGFSGRGCSSPISAAAIAFISTLLLLVTNLYEPSAFSLQWLYARQMEITLATVTGLFHTGTCCTHGKTLETERTREW